MIYIVTIDGLEVGARVFEHRLSDIGLECARKSVAHELGFTWGQSGVNLK